MRRGWREWEAQRSRRQQQGEDVRSAEEASDSPTSATVHDVVVPCGSVRAIALAAKKGPFRLYAD